jgi:hypothetical protein
MDRCQLASGVHRASIVTGLAIGFLAVASATAQAQSASYKKQFSLQRSPDDVAFTKRGGIAVVRASQHYPDQFQGPQPSVDQVVPLCQRA